MMVNNTLTKLGDPLNKTFDLQAYFDNLPCLGFSNKVDIIAEEDYLSIGLYPESEMLLTNREGIKDCKRYPKKETVKVYSEAFKRVEERRARKARGESMDREKGQPELIERLMGGFKIKADF